MALKNYTSEVPVERTLQHIQKILSSNGADRVTIEYFRGAAVGVSFVLNIEKRPMHIKLPARLEKVPFAMYGREVCSENEKQQVYRTAWKNIHDWIDAQLALVQTSMVKLEEVFLPYIQDKQGVTFFERMEQQGFLLESGKRQE